MRTSSGDKRKRKQGSESEKAKDELAAYYEEQVKPLLAQMEEKFLADSTSELCRDCLKLWNLLERKGMMGKASGSSSARRRGEILKTLFKFLDVTDPRLMLRLGKLILSVSTMWFMLGSFHFLLGGRPDKSQGGHFKYRL